MKENRAVVLSWDEQDENKLLKNPVKPVENDLIYAGNAVIQDGDVVSIEVTAQRKSSEGKIEDLEFHFSVDSSNNEQIIESEVEEFADIVRSGVCEVIYRKAREEKKLLEKSNQ